MGRETTMRRKTLDLYKNDKHVTLSEDELNHYSPELIRKYEDPEYAKAAEEYERQERMRKARQSMQGQDGQHSQNAQYSHHSQQQSSGRHSSDVRQQAAPYTEDDLFPQSQTAAAGHGGGRHSGGGSSRKVRHRVNKKTVARNVILLILIFIIALVAYFFSVTSHFDKVDTSGSDFAISSQAAKDLSGYRNIAILGVDARADEGYDGSRTDAIIIMSIKKSTGEIRLISVMRDSYLKVADADGNLILDKITHAHHYGGGADTCASLNRSLDLNISEFVIFNWKAVADTVDALGGITINVRSDEISDMNTYGHETAINTGGTYTRITKSGVQRLDGVQAATYCRIRKTSGGDSGRARRYKKVMDAVMKETLSSPLAMNKLAKDVLPEIRTNMSQVQMLTAVIGAPRYDITKNIAWPKNYYGGIFGGIWYAVPDTLETNVARLHLKAFDQAGYTPSQTCLDINDEIINDTGVQ